MATLAINLRRASPRASTLAVPLALGIIGLILSWFGAAWDVSWHRLLGRDTFWSPPHLFLYSGVGAWGLAGLTATLTAMRGRPLRGPALRVGPFVAELGLALVGVGSAMVIGAAPLDDAWHQAFGRDVDIWSPPHLFAVSGTALAFVGWALALRPGTFTLPEGLRRILRVVVLGNLCGVLVFGMNFYYFMTVTREAFFYPLAVCLVIPAVLALGATLIGGRWAATLIAASYTFFALVTYAVLEFAGWRPPAFPPLIVGGAVAIDVLRARGGRFAHPLPLGAAFAVAFVVAETLRTAVIAPPAAPVVAGPGVDPRLSNLFFQYYAQTVARPWASLWPVLAAAVGAPLAAVSWRLGGALARLSADDRDRQSLAHP